VRLQPIADRLQLEVEDTGPGFDLNALQKGKSLGILNMHERAQLAGGTLQFITRPGRGVRIVANLPMKVARSNDSGAFSSN
jgi:signal transduction histidine kinase